MSSDDDFLDSLFVGKVVVPGPPFATIELPAFEALSAADREKWQPKVFARINAEIDNPPLDVETLKEKLRDLPSRESSFTTPEGPSYGEMIEEWWPKEEKARKILDEDGCPPCYPASLGFPPKDIPEEFTAIISYWKAEGKPEELMLTGQLNNWKEFRYGQQRVRQHYLRRPEKSFSDYEKKVRDRLQRHGFEGDVRLRLKLKEQSRLQNWIEFQDYHLQKLEKLEKELKDEKEELKAARAQPVDTAHRRLLWTQEHECGPSTEEHHPSIRVYVIESNANFCETNLRRHKILLQWIEHQRIAMVNEPSTHVIKIEKNEDHDDRPKNPGNPPSLNRRKRKSTARSVLSPIRSGVSKNPPKKRSLRPRKRDAPCLSNIVNPPSDNNPRTSDSKTKPQHRQRGTPLHPGHSYRVSKTPRQGQKGKASGRSKVRPRSMSERQDTRSRKTPGQAARERERLMVKSMPVIVRTRSGRVSKIPERFCPS